MMYTTITNREYYETLLEDAQEGVTNWSINKNAQSSDVVLLYVCAPISAIVATATVIDSPVKDTDINSIWFGSYFSDMENLRILNRPITRNILLGAFPEWRYWTQPRNSVQVPNDYAVKIERMLM